MLVFLIEGRYFLAKNAKRYLPLVIKKKLVNRGGESAGLILQLTAAVYCLALQKWFLQEWFLR